MPDPLEDRLPACLFLTVEVLEGAIVGGLWRNDVMRFAKGIAVIDGELIAIEIIFGADKKWRGDKRSAPPQGSGKSWQLPGPTK